jgi:ubiquinone/menaquinone biosynthesis C-methylase UbiE
MPAVDVYRITNELDDPTLDVMIARLETRGRQPRFVQMMHEYLDAMTIARAGRMLDLGCGTGVVSRAIARREGFGGRVLGLDISPYLIAAAERFAKQDRVAHAVQFRCGDSRSLDLADGAFDAAVAHTLISHVEDPAAVLREIARVVAPGGKIGIFDGDYASMTFGSDDPQQGRADDEAIAGAIVTQPRVMRQMPQLLREAGLRLERSFAYLVADVGTADFFAPTLQSFLKLLPKAGAMTERRAQDFVAAMMRRSEQGVFFAACNFYAYVATRT